MALIFADRVRDTSTTTGTGTITLADSAPTGFRKFGDVCANGDTVPYTIEMGGEWEVGIGTYSTSGPTLSRDTIKASSNGGSAVNFSAGTKQVYLSAIASHMEERVVGPASATDNTLPRFDGTTGKTLQTSGVTIDDSDNMGGIVALSARSLNLNNPSGNTGFEIGPQSGVAGAAFIDFHTSATLQDYNVRLLATGDVGNGLGTLAVTAGSFTWGGSPLLVANDIGSTVQAYDADTLKADTSDDLTAGFTATSADQGTKSSGTFTPTFATRNVQHCVNGGAFTLGEPTGHGSLVLDITNNSSAGAITTSAFDLVTGDDFTTTNGHKFRCFITCGNIGSHLHVVAFQ
jgi:hypothetical protein